ILFEGNRAVGVEFDRNMMTSQIRARREVILSAGTTNSAQLLMLSGIGPKEHLAKFNIPLVADLPVGNNLQDHGAGFLSYTLSPKIQTAGQKLQSNQSINEYIYGRSGMSLCSTEKTKKYRKDHKFNPLQNHACVTAQLQTLSGLSNFQTNT
ncbi:Oxygen-dependent choline dehydrogenase, partial [Araneus ventricosus]